MRKNNFIFIGIMTTVVGLVIILAIVGPLNHVFKVRNDTLIENNLNEVANAVSVYYRKDSTLPKSINEIDLKGDAKELITNNLVEYIPEDDAYYIRPYTAGITNDYNKVSPQGKYQLCVTYVASNNEDYVGGVSKSEYTEYLSNYYHPEGRVCYKLLTSAYSY